MPRVLLVTGSRDWADVRTIEDTLNSWLAASPEPLVLVHGACPTGADAIADRWSRRNGVTVRAYRADWGRYGKRAGPLRNEQMLRAEPNLRIVCAFSRGNSRGTEHTLGLCRNRPGVILDVHREN